MKELTCLEMVDLAKNTKRMHKIYFFSALNNASPSLLQAISCRIKEKSGLNDEQCQEAQQICHRQWDETLLQAEAWLDMHDEWKDLLSGQLKDLSSSEKNHIHNLLKTLLLLSFEKASLNALKNRMKEKDLKEYSSYLKSSQTGMIRLAIRSLFQRVIDQNTSPTKGDFIQAQLALADLLADDLLNHLQSGSNKPIHQTDYLAFVPASPAYIQQQKKVQEQRKPALTLTIND